MHEDQVNRTIRAEAERLQAELRAAEMEFSRRSLALDMAIRMHAGTFDETVVTAAGKFYDFLSKGPSPVRPSPGTRTESEIRDAIAEHDRDEEVYGKMKNHVMETAHHRAASALRWVLKEGETA